MNNNSGFLIAVIIMAVLVFGVGLLAYQGFTKASNQKQLAEDRAAEAANANSAVERLTRGVGDIQQTLGYQGELSGDAEDSVRNKLIADMQNYGGSEFKETVAGTLQSLRGALDAERTRVADLEAANSQLQDRINVLEREYQQKVTVAEEAASNAKNDLNNVVVTNETELLEKENQITEFKQRAKDAVATAIAERRTFTDQIEEMNREIENYDNRIVFLSNELAEKNKVSFERPDGTIVRTDPTQELVYVKLGSRDGLGTRTTFSVYKKNNAGIGRGLEDVKGAIEIIRILDDHLSEARILEEDQSNPISPGDFVYSPVWQAGQKNFFSFVGEIDLDNDGQDDRELLFQMIRDQGSEIELYIDEQGQRRDGRGELAPDKTLSSKTKFLVIGEVPDRTDIPPQREEYDWAVAIGDRRAELEKEANQQGILKVNLPDFQSYIGYKPTQRLFLPGNRRSAENLRNR